MPTVYVTQIPSRYESQIGTDGKNIRVWVPIVDVTPAKLFGEINIMLPAGLNYPDAQSVAIQLRKILINFNPDTDYLLALGDPVVISVASALIGYDHGYFRLLKWDRRASSYNSYQIEVQGNH